MKTKHFLKALYHHFQTTPFLFPLEESLVNLQESEKKEKALFFYNQGLLKFSQQNSLFIKDFDFSFQLNFSQDDSLIHMILLTAEWSLSTQDEKLLNYTDVLFSRLSSLSFPLYYSWGKTLLKLYQLNSKIRFLKLAQEKFQLAQMDISKAPANLLHAFYWDLALLWSNLACDSGEALDIRKALQALKLSSSYETKPSSAFNYDCGSIHLQMMTKVNEPALAIKAIDYFKLALEQEPSSYKYLSSIAECYQSLYLCTLNHQYFDLAESYLAQCLKENPNDAQILLKWAQLLFEEAKNTQNARKLRLALEKLKTASFSNQNSYLLALEEIKIQSFLSIYTNSYELLVKAEKNLSSLNQKHLKDTDLILTEALLDHAFYLYYQDPLYEEKAQEKYCKALSHDSQNASILHLLAKSYTILGKESSHIELLKKGSIHYKKALHLKPYHPLLHYDYALNLIILSDLTCEDTYIQEALEQLEKLLSSQKDSLLEHPEWLYHYGLALDLLGDLTEDENSYFKAVEILHQVLLIDPDYPKIHLTLASAYAHLAESNFDKEYFQQAMKFFQMAQKTNPEDDEVYLEWALAYISLAFQSDGVEKINALYKQAEEMLIKSASLGNQECYYHLACLYSLNQRFDLAMQFLKKAEENQMLPSIEEMKEDEWLDALQAHDQYIKFISELETKQHFFDEK
jgi:tetratricopeptide (TPR) repeat protein